MKDNLMFAGKVLLVIAVVAFVGKMVPAIGDKARPWLTF